MGQDIREKLENLSEKLSADDDIISLKALCNVPEDERIIAAKEETIRRLKEKYPEDEEILELFGVESISLGELLDILYDRYPDNTDVITISALESQPNNPANRKAIEKCLERLLDQHICEEYIELYFDKTRKEIAKKITSKDKKEDMIYVRGGTYTPSFFKEKRKTFDIFVSKYDVTNDEWDKLMESNPSNVLGPRKPVNNVDRISSFKFCNKLSEQYGYTPVYKIENDKLVKIVYKDGQEVFPNLADFSKTEGYRLPTEIEWEWFAWGGKETQKSNTFDKTVYIKELTGEEKLDQNTRQLIAFLSALGEVFTKAEDYSDFAWYGKCEIHDVGLKKPNELGLYDVIGNVSQHVYDTDVNGYIDEKRLNIYDDKFAGRLRGGNCKCEIGITFFGGDLYGLRDVTMLNKHSRIDTAGFRVVRTAM